MSKNTPILLLLGTLLLWYTLCLPRPLFDVPYSSVLEARDGQLLGAHIAKDGQWRFPVSDSLSERFVAALIEFEDRRFYRHPGVDPIGIGRAIKQNVTNRRVVSGGSTLSMQVIRMARGPRRRNIWNKIIEAILATRLELKYTKQEILQLYAAHAPFGGNVVGVEAACWRYFGQAGKALSWGEAATPAVLPNSPGLIHPGRNRQALREKRDRLLDRLFEAGKFDSLSLQLAKEEALPEVPYRLPRMAPHLLDRARSLPTAPARLRSTIDIDLQRRVNYIAEQSSARLADNQIHNLAILVADVESGATLAYVGNAPQAGEAHHGAVDVIPAPRSTGSILKPFLYAGLLSDGQMLPQSLISDVPTFLSGYRPENFAGTFDGVVTADEALVRSLNVPAVIELQQYGLGKFHRKLQQLGLTHLEKSADHYGLTLVLGGAEASLWDVAGAYASLGRQLLHYAPQDGYYNPEDIRPLHFLAATPEKTRPPQLHRDPTIFDAAAIWQTFETLQNLDRPDTEGQWRRFSSQDRWAWKTGTSFGFRDAWAVGLNGRYLVAVWIGNADGEGRPGLVGVKAAAPVFFAVANELPAAPWFNPPYDALYEQSCCAVSGYAALPGCPIKQVQAAKLATALPPCTYHETLLLTADGRQQADASCYPIDQLQTKTFFVLPPLAAHYYSQQHADYQPLPPWLPGCAAGQLSDQPMQLIYPRYPAEIFVPRQLDGTPSATVFSVAHRNPRQKIHWHLNERYLATTEDFHSLELNPGPGEHQLSLVDEQGRRLEQIFVIINAEK